MCDRCKELESQIEHFRKLVDAAFDLLTRERANTFLANLQEEKRRLHPS